MHQLLRRFFAMEASSGILLVICAVAAMLVANSSIAPVYHDVLHYKLFELSLSHWVNDGLMAVFFLLIGLEVKRELIDGALSTKEAAIFPAIAALGGMLVPALIYSAFTYEDSTYIQGWAIPAATDIAFALGILALLSDRVPPALKVFLLALAIIDDLGVIVIIALFYTSDLSTLATSVALASVAVLFLMNYFKVKGLKPYLFVGAILWLAVLKSGVHATLAGVILGFAIPYKDEETGHSPSHHLEHKLHEIVNFMILPLFAFANSGISLQGIGASDLFEPVTLGIMLGLFVGKPLGVFSFSWLALKLGVAHMPKGVNIQQIFAVAVLCGIGFTMSIFISSLAFGEGDEGLINLAKMGILMGSTTAAIIGYWLLRMALPKSQSA